jgi:hypothetical protein
MDKLGCYLTSDWNRPVQPTAGRQPADRLPEGRAIARHTRMPGGVGGVTGAIPSPRTDYASSELP